MKASLGGFQLLINKEMVMSNNVLKYTLALAACLSASGAANAASCKFDVKVENVSTGTQKPIRIRAMEAYVFYSENSRTKKKNYYNFFDMSRNDLEVFNSSDLRGAINKKTHNMPYSSYIDLKKGDNFTYEFDIDVKKSRPHGVMIRYFVQVSPYRYRNSTIYNLDTVCEDKTHEIDLNRAFIPTEND